MAKKKLRISQASIVQKGQGARLQEFFISKDFKSRNAFANAIGASSSSINEVIWGCKLISRNLFSRIKRKFPDIDESWLLDGVQSSGQDPHSKVAESKPDYFIEGYPLPPDQLIQQQSKLIDQQRKTIDQLMKQIELLKYSQQ